jgi:hypothetical protein
MRFHRSVILVLATATALTAAFEPAAAEGFFRKLFGWGAPRQQEYREMPAPTYNFGFGAGQGYDPYYDGGGYQEDVNAYRTLCVRTCDGFYFPIGDNVRRERLYQDARTCTARCDGEARLFYYPTNGGSVETMVDMSGRPYAQLPTAFLYRKSLVEGCSCKPAPWSAEAAARHQQYAAEDQALAAMRNSGQLPDRQGDDIEGFLQRESSAVPQTQWRRGGTRRY